MGRFDLNSKQMAVRDLVSTMYEQGSSLEEMAGAVREMHCLSAYTPKAASLDLWYVVSERVFHRTHLAAKTARFVYKPELDEQEYPCTYASVIVGGTTKAYDDLYKGRPCTLASKSPWNTGTDRCWTDKGGQELHGCSQDAWAWLTSTHFLQTCKRMAWDWRLYMEYAIHQAAETAAAFPWIPLIPALVWRIATTLEGEAGSMGPTGMWYVGDTMLGRVARGDSWDDVLAQYYATSKVPSEEAMVLANTILRKPWKPSGRVFCYSESDRVNQGWRKGELIYGVNGQTLHMSQAWPG